MDVREKLVELLCKSGSMKCDSPTGECTNCLKLADHLIANGVTVQEDCKACAEATQNCIVKLQEQIAGLRSVQEWISVKERKPDLELVEAKADDFDLYACLATIKNERARNGRYVGKAWYDGERFMDSDCVDITYDVTHWMPLPQPPKGE